MRSVGAEWYRQNRFDSYPAPPVAPDVTPQAQASNVVYAALTTEVTL